MPISLKPFDPTREFVTATAFRAGGRAWGRGYTFDKSVVNERVLERLYDQRRIIYDDDPRAVRLMTGGGGRASATGAGAKASALPNEAASEESLIDKLKAKFSKSDLLERAAKIPGVQRSMNKTELATALVRSGHGDT